MTHLFSCCPFLIKNTIKMTNIKKDLILTEDTTFNESITVEGDIKGYFNLKVVGNINAKNIDAWSIKAKNIDAWDIDAWNIDAWNIKAKNIDAWNIDAWDIKAKNIDAWNIDAWDIDAWDIICEKRIKKSNKAKTFSRIFIQNKSKLERKEQLKSSLGKEKVK